MFQFETFFFALVLHFQSSLKVDFPEVFIIKFLALIDCYPFYRPYDGALSSNARFDALAPVSENDQGNTYNFNF